MDELNLPPELIERASAVKLLLMDCDGVLTDGRLYFSGRGEELKVFDVKDGQGLALWHAAGYRSGIISGRGASEMIGKRAAELGIQYVYVNSVDKVRDLNRILADAGSKAEETAYIGDDIGDILPMKECGFPVAVADAVPEVVAAACYVTRKPGGRGAVREVADLLLKARSETIP